MRAFRILALAYALVALMIAPSWLTADEVVPAVPEPVAEEPGAPTAQPDPAGPDAPVQHSAGKPSTGAVDEPEPPAAVEEPVADEEPAAAADASRANDRPVAKAAADGSVTITDFEFTPATITVNEGDTVTWTNKGPTPHTATAEDGSFDTGNLDQGESGSATFTSAGTIPYICTPHPFMTGKVVVRAAAAGDDGAGSDDGADDDTAGSGAAGDGDAAEDADDGSGLPATGTETLIIALLGLATLGAGLLLRHRAT